MDSRRYGQEEASKVQVPERPAAPPVPPGADPDRDRRIGIYRDRERRRAARALDRYIETMWPTLDQGETFVAGERFVEAVGDYVLSRLHHNGDYGVPAGDWNGLHVKGCPGAFGRPCRCLAVDAPDVHPCAGGRCSDPAAHAEGAHDL